MNSKIKLSDQNYEVIKQHILDPENTPLDELQQDQLNRLLSVARVLDKHPVKKQALALHMAKYPELSWTTALRDVNSASLLYTSYKEFDWDFWQTWLINDITKSIRICRDSGAKHLQKLIPHYQANLIKVIGNKPPELDDPNRNEKNTFVLMINLGKEQFHIDLDNLDKLPNKTVQELNRLLFSGRDIDDAEAEEIMNS
jgi:hypothetical protein